MIRALPTPVIYLPWLFAALVLLPGAPLEADSLGHDIALVIHGGAGTIRKSDLSPDEESAYRAELKDALMKGYLILKAGGSSLDAVEAAVQLLEDSPLFNAGKGAVFTAEGKNELDASIMDGSTLMAGAVAGVTTIRNPVRAARAVMEQTNHVMLVGEGAEVFAASVGLEIVDPSYFYTQRRWESLERIREQQQVLFDPPNRASGSADRSPCSDCGHGTVGALALDQMGHLAAATSTGGLTNKRYGRIGDSPIIGAGTYANSFCAVSATGQGEYFIRYTVARDICARAEYLKISVAEAAETVIHQVLPEIEGGTGGVITLDAEGNVSMPFNTAGMYRGRISADGRPVIAIYGDSNP